MSEEFNEIRKKQVAQSRPEIFCVLSAKYIDVDIQCSLVACFFTEEEAKKCLDYMDKNQPVNKAVGWYEIEQTKLSFFNEN